jgi:hypothetical protein
MHLVGDFHRGNALAFGEYSIDMHRIKAGRAQKRGSQRDPSARTAVNEKPPIFRQFA